MASGIFLAQHYQCPAHIYWNNTQGLKAQFSDLFLPLNIPAVKLTENNHWLYRIDSTYGYLLRRLPLMLKYQVIYNFSRYNDGDITTHICTERNPILISCFSMCSHYHLKDLFVPQLDIQQKITEIISRFSSYTIGVHIRRTDNRESIKRSPIEAFTHSLTTEIEQNPSVMFYLASDDEDVKQMLIEKYPGRMITYSGKVFRNSLEGMKSAVIDLFCLSNTQKIIGSDYSSYSQIAAELGGIPLEYASSDKN